MPIATHQRGFSLIEMIVAMLVLAVLASAAGYGLLGGARAYNSSADAIHTLSKLRLAGERLTRELREIRRDPVTPARYDISTMTATSLVFTKADGTVVSLTSAAPLATLAYNTPAGTHTLTDEVNSLAFAYYQSDGIAIAPTNDLVAFVEFELVLIRNGNLYPQRTRVALRNQS